MMSFYTMQKMLAKLSTTNCFKSNRISILSVLIKLMKMDDATLMVEVSVDILMMLSKRENHTEMYGEMFFPINL